ncbi:DUF5687 family protein [Lutimonas saemankumensis]|uniref:DUF5687 family protein n=1 Tax=Lutimonas saemankumensis TaxID=483016 RepID=UPI001CD7BCD1|nr:DUF5687 family protein [Lutimonas saemankumensis]MCA0932368.1 DUF5687 family protein [Lutimonas saemankumensis]
MVSDFTRLEWKQFIRSSYWQKSIALNIFLVFIALYFIVVFLGLGLGLYPILKKQFPEKDPFELVNQFVFYWFLIDLLMRFFFQKLPVMSIKPLLTLPLKKSKIVHYVLGKSVISFFNFLPLFAVIPFGIILISNDYDTLKVLNWIIFMLIASLIINFLNFIIENKSAQTELSMLPILILVGGLYLLNHFQLIAFNELLYDAINWVISNSLFLALPLLLLGLCYFMNYKLLLSQLYIDKSLQSKRVEVSASDLSWTDRFGASAPFLQLDLRMLWRNKRPRSSLFIVLIGLFYGLIFYPNPTYQSMQGMFVFVGIFVTGIFLINFGQFIPAWDSGYYKMLMSQNIPYKDYLKSKFLLMASSALLMFVLSIPYVYFGWEILLIHFAAMIYNIGINTHVLLYAGSFNRKRIDLTQRAAFNYQGTGAVQWLVGIPLLLIPVLLFYLPYKLLNFESAIAILIVIGISGILFHEKLMAYITNKYIESKYKMISAFDQDN